MAKLLTKICHGTIEKGFFPILSYCGPTWNFSFSSWTFCLHTDQNSNWIKFLYSFGLKFTINPWKIFFQDSYNSNKNSYENKILKLTWKVLEFWALHNTRFFWLRCQGSGNFQGIWLIHAVVIQIIVTVWYIMTDSICDWLDI